MRFVYQVDQDFIELKASNWIGSEMLFVNGQLIQKRFNFSPSSNHQITLSNGLCCRFQVFIDPTHEQLVCRIYKQNELLARLVQHKSRQTLIHKYINGFLCILSLIALALMSY